MLITLIGKNSLNKLTLPDDKVGNFILYDKDTGNRLINVESYNNNWEIRTNYHCKMLNNKNVTIHEDAITINRNGKEVLEKIALHNNNFYFAIIDEELYVLYCSPIYEENYIHLRMKSTTQIYIGNDENINHIIYDNPIVGKIHAKIYFFNGVCWINNYDKNFNTFVNGKPIYNEPKMISNGDTIFIMGLTIIMMNKDLFINNPINRVRYNCNYFERCMGTNNKYLELEDEDDFSKYLNKDYFLRTPRMLELVETKKMEINAPNTSEKTKEMPAALVLASSLSMGLMSILTIVQAVDGFASGKTTAKDFGFSLAMALIMLLTTILIPVLNMAYSKKIKKIDEKDEAKRYKKYIENKAEWVEKTLAKDRETLYKTYVNSEECMDIILNNRTRLWERQLSDDDFLTVRLGIGDVPSSIDVSYTKRENMDNTSDAYKLMMKCVEQAKTMKDAPVLLSLKEKNISAIIYKNEEVKYRYLQSLLLQIITFQSYDELKLVFLLKDNSDNKWDFVKMLPHLWNNPRTMRFFADDKDSINEVSQYLENELGKRNKNNTYAKDDEMDIKPYYLIISDDYKNIEDLNIIKDVVKSNTNVGFSLLFLTDSLFKLPNECQTFINIENSDEGVLFENKNPTQTKTAFTISTSEIYFFDKINPIISDIVIKYEDEKELSLPSSYTFLEMYNVGNIEQLNIMKRWKEHDSTLSLNAPIGIDGSGRHVSLDIHEKYHGPHGLIAGSTGSGKSEFIITYILSLAVNFHPDDVTFVLIDYKGGGLAGAFQRPDVKLPHVVGTITNIDKGSLQRSLESIQSELKRRQVEFNEAKFATGESTIDIYKYQKYYHNGVLKKPISHLFIICDEFAELKQQEPDFMDELISVARIGRSLGVHLILATQKPSGVVNDQIRSNMKFGVCLKVQTPGDSKEVIDIPDAAKLSSAGQFYLKVGNEDYLALGQSGWAGALYCPSDEVKKDFDNSIEFVSNTGKVIKKIDDTKKNARESKGEQLTNLVQFMSDLAEKENIHEETLWLDPIPGTIYLKDIREKYNVKTDEEIINPVIGEYDDPSKQLQDIYTLNLTQGGNCIVYGNAESGKETLISTMIYDIITNYSSESAQMYILDFGSETFKIFKNSNFVGDVIVASEGEKITRFFMMLRKELKERKELLSEYNGDMKLYKKITKKIIPTYIIILNNYEAFTENYPDRYDDIIETLLREGVKYGYVFIFTTGTTSGIRYRTQQNFKQKISLQMNKDSDYQSIFDFIGKKRPSRLFGRGLINPEGREYYEFQTAKICEAEVWNEKIREVIEEQNKVNPVKAKEIPTVPEIVTINHLGDYIKDLSRFPIGISNKNITPCLIDIKHNFVNLIVSNMIDDYIKFITSMIEILKLMENVEPVVLDAMGIVQGSKEDVKNKYIETFREIGKNKNSNEIIFIIIGLDKFINSLGSEDMFY